MQARQRVETQLTAGSMLPMRSAKQLRSPAHDISPENSISVLQQPINIPGRMQSIDQGQPFSVVVDYAHTPDSIEKVLGLLRDLNPAGRLIIVMGSAGERDRSKRPLQGFVASRGADFSIFTTEDPRFEDPEAIIDEIAGGAEAAGGTRNVDFCCVTDRRDAIAAAFERALPGDCVILAGKGMNRASFGEGATAVGRGDRRKGPTGGNGVRQRAAVKMTRAPRFVIAFLLLLTTFAGTAFVARAQSSTIPGRLLFVRDGNIWTWTYCDVALVVEDGHASNAVWSPDGKRILFVRTGNSYSDLEIYDIATGQTSPVTYNQPDYEVGTPEYIQASAWAIDPDWSSSGLIGFITDRDSEDGTSFELLIDDPTAGAYRAPLAESEDNIEALSLSSGGSLAAYSVQARLDDGTSANRVILRDLTDGVAYPLAEGNNAYDPAISPDAKTIAVTIRNQSEMSDLFLVDRASGKVTRATRNLEVSNPTWSPDGKWIAYIRMIDYEFEVWASPVENGNPGRPFKIFKANTSML